MGKIKNLGSNYGYTTSQPESPERAAQVLCNLARGHALLTGRNFVTLEDIPIVVKTALSTAIIDRVSLLHTLIANEGSLNTKQVANALKVVNKTALWVMTELCVIGLVDMWDDTTTTDRYTKRITLKEEFQWLLSKDFQKLCEGFNPVNYKPVKESKAEAEAGTKKDSFSKERISMFWKTFDKLVEGQIRSNPGMEIDKGTISREALQDELVSTGNFIQSDANLLRRYEYLLWGHTTITAPKLFYKVWSYTNKRCLARN